MEFGAPKVNTPQIDDLSSWVNQESALNGLENLATPWRIVISYEQFDGTGTKFIAGRIRNSGLDQRGIWPAIELMT